MNTQARSLTENEVMFMQAARRMQDAEGSFCFVDLNHHGYDVPETTRRATLGSLVKKGVVSEPVDGWSVIL